MQTKTKRLLATAAVLVVVLIIYLIATAPPPSPRQQIATAIQTACGAASHRRASGVLTVVSADYRDPNVANVDQLHAILIQGFRNSGPVDVRSTDNAITVHGDNAQSVSHITIKGGPGGQTYFDGNIVLYWKREPARRFLMFPSTTWRIVSAAYPGLGGGGE